MKAESPGTLSIEEAEHRGRRMLGFIAAVGLVVLAAGAVGAEVLDNTNVLNVVTAVDVVVVSGSVAVATVLNNKNLERSGQTRK